MNMPVEQSISDSVGILVYDVPTKRGDIRPPLLLHKIASKINKSAWLITATNFRRVPVDEWRAKGADVEAAFDQAGMLRLAKKGILSECAQISLRLTKACAKAEELYARALENLGNEVVLKMADRQAYMAMRHARQAINAAQEAAMAFDITHEVGEWDNVIGNAIKAQSLMLQALRSHIMVEKAKTEVKP